MLENSKTVKSRNRRVVNGLAVINSWDWLVRLEFFSDNSNIGSLCGGTVGRGRPVSRRLVVYLCQPWILLHNLIKQTILYKPGLLYAAYIMQHIISPYLHLLNPLYISLFKILNSALLDHNPGDDPIHSHS